MKTIQSLCLLLFLTTVTFAQKPFEGTVYYKISGLEQVTTSVEVDGEEVEKTEEQNVTQMESTIFIKNKKAVIEVKAGNGLTLYLDEKTNEFIVSYQMPDGVKVVREPIDEAKKIDQKLTATKTGNSKTINGYLCFEYNVKNVDGELGTLWAAPQLQLDLMEVPLVGLFIDKMAPFLKPIEGVDGFVLVMASTKGGTITTIDIIVTEKKIEETRFKLPETVKELTKEEQLQKIIEEYTAKMLDAADDEVEMKRLSEEMGKKMEAVQNQ